MGSYGLSSGVAVVEEIGNIDSLLAALTSLSEGDCDWIGENGPGCTSEEALAAGFESTQEYTTDTLKKKYEAGELTEEELANMYLELWLDSDGYYEENDIHVCTNDNNQVVAVGYASKTYC